MIPAQKSICLNIDVSKLRLRKNTFMSVSAGEDQVEIIYADDGTVQVRMTGRAEITLTDEGEMVVEYLVEHPDE